MIDTTCEEILTFKQAADWLPRRRAGRKASTSTIWRWASSGIHGIQLECIHIGGIRCTSQQALQRFFDRIGQARSGSPRGSMPAGSHSAVRTEAERRRATEIAGQRLDDLLAHPPRRGRKAVSAAD